VFAGTINAGGRLVIRCTKTASKSTLARIIQLVEEAQSTKSKTQVFTDKTTPGMMKNDHRVRSGVWAKLVVQKGEVVFEIPERNETITVTADSPAIIEPVVMHRILPQAGARFYLEYYR